MMDIERLKNLGYPDAEIVGEKAGKSIVRVYTDEKGWQYEKVSDDAAFDTFAAKIKAPQASRANLKAGK
jgi:uncharacterized protein (DUF2141 family)